MCLCVPVYMSVSVYVHMCMKVPTESRIGCLVPEVEAEITGVCEPAIEGAQSKLWCSQWSLKWFLSLSYISNSWFRQWKISFVSPFPGSLSRPTNVKRLFEIPSVSSGEEPFLMLKFHLSNSLLSSAFLLHITVPAPKPSFPHFTWWLHKWNIEVLSRSSGPLEECPDCHPQLPRSATRQVTPLCPHGS